MAFDLQEDMIDIFLDSGFEEDVIYIDVSGIPKTIKAIINRQELKQTARNIKSSDNTNMRLYDVEIEISTDATDGISSIKIKTDKVALKRKIGDTLDTTMSVDGILYNDSGAWKLGLK